MTAYGAPTIGREGWTARRAPGRIPPVLLGQTRVAWVRIQLGDGGPACHVFGTCRHHPVSRPVSLSVATALMAKGVPSVVRRASGLRPVTAG